MKPLLTLLLTLGLLFCKGQAQLDSYACYDSVLAHLTYKHDTITKGTFVFTPAIKFKDTAILVIRDTVTKEVHDTLIKTNIITDTIKVIDTIVRISIVRDTLYRTDTLINIRIIKDTFYIVETDTVRETLLKIDTLYIENYREDTLVINNTAWLHDTLYSYIHDTAYLHDTITISQATAYSDRDTILMQLRYILVVNNIPRLSLVNGYEIRSAKWVSGYTTDGSERKSAIYTHLDYTDDKFKPIDANAKIIQAIPETTE